MINYGCAEEKMVKLMNPFVDYGKRGMRDEKEKFKSKLIEKEGKKKRENS